MASQGKAEKNWSLIVPGVLLIFFGALCAFYPGITLLSVTFVAGAGFVFAGIVNIISYVRERKTAGLSGWYVAYGILEYHHWFDVGHPIRSRQPMLYRGSSAPSSWRIPS